MSKISEGFCHGLSASNPIMREASMRVGSHMNKCGPHGSGPSSEHFGKGPIQPIVLAAMMLLSIPILRLLNRPAANSARLDSRNRKAAKRHVVDPARAASPL